MDHKGQEEIALHRWAVIAEAAGAGLTPAERGALVRQIAARAHTHPDGSARRYSRGTTARGRTLPGPGPPGGAARGGVGRGAEGLRPVRGSAPERAVDHRRADRAVG